MINKTLIVLMELILISFLPSNALAQQRNVISSCSVLTTAGIVGKGRCIIKTYICGNYIMVEVHEPWERTPNPGKPSLIRLVNKQSCTTWSYGKEDGCKGEFWYDDEWSWGYVHAEGNNKGFLYSLGKSYTVFYDGPFPRPLKPLQEDRD